MWAQQYEGEQIFHGGVRQTVLRCLASTAQQHGQGAPKRRDGTQRRCVSASSRLSAARGIVYSASSARRDFFSISSDTDAHSPADERRTYSQDRGSDAQCWKPDSIFVSTRATTFVRPDRQGLC